MTLKTVSVFLRAALPMAVTVLSSGVAAHGSQATGGVSELKKLSLEELLTIDVTSASRTEEKLLQTPAAVYVITREDIRRSGVTSIPEALRLAPGVEVARVGAHSWAISIRGFRGDLSNKLLVLIDGRSVYSPLYAGVFWDAQDVLLEDIDQIEVVSGPGGTLWGANAVNGVINVITRSAHETRGGFVEAGGGNEDRGFGAFRYGGRIGEDAYARGYVKHFERDSSRIANDGDGHDDWHMSQLGFRVDWDLTESDRLTFQGDLYRAEEAGLFRDDFELGTLPGPLRFDKSDFSGANVMARWSRQSGADSELQLQIYYDRTRRDIPATYSETRDTFDVDLQHVLMLGGRHQLLWGVGLRATSDELDNTQFAAFDPDSRTDLTFSPFVQDRISLWSDRLFLTLGSKLAHNDYTGLEVQPNVRLAWLIDQRQTAWTAVSRAVRVPSRLDADLRLTAPISVPEIPFPVYAIVNGTDDFDSEELVAYEAGYRIRLGDELSLDAAVFFNDYDRLQTFEPAPPVILPDPSRPYILLPNYVANGLEGESHGGSFLVNWQPGDWWRSQFQYTYIDLELVSGPRSLDVSSKNLQGNSPSNQFSLSWFFDLPQRLSLFTGLRFVGEVPNQDVRAYTDLNVHLIWQFGGDFELGIGGRNLLHDRHPEFGGGNEIERAITGKLTWRF